MTRKNNKKNSTLMNDSTVEESELDRKYILNFIPQFSGVRSEYHRFVTSCDLIYSNLNLDNDRTEFVDIIKVNKLIGTAYDAVKYKRFKDWPSLKSEIKKCFIGTRTAAQIHIDFAKIRQGNENIQNFSNKIENLLSELDDVSLAEDGSACNAHILKLNNKTAIKAFEDGLNNPIGYLIKACRFSSLSDAIARALEEEQSIKNNSYNSNQKHNSPICQLCNKKGHVAKNCFSLRQNSNNSGFRNISNNQLQGHSRHSVQNFNVACAYCHIPGHTINQCFKKQAADNRKNHSGSTRTFHNSNKTFNQNSNNKIQPTGNGSENSNRLEQTQKSQPTRVADLQLAQII